MKYTNRTNISLPLQVWLAVDLYDHDPNPYAISATSLLKPVRAMILARRVQGEGLIDLDDLVASRMGSAVHDSIENAWKNHRKLAFQALNIPQKVEEKVLINPARDHIQEDSIPIYLEMRSKKKMGKWTVHGKFDMVYEGEVNDVKTTKTFSYIKGDNVKDYRLQGSIYRWLNPDIITSDSIAIQYLFTDWVAHRAKADADYPQTRMLEKRYPLFSISETEYFLKEKLNLLERYENEDQALLPECKSKELWQQPTRYAYYKNPEKTTRATRVFDSRDDAFVYMGQNGGKGKVVERPGEVKRCLFCPARSICSQAERLQQEGLIKDA